MLVPVSGPMHLLFPLPGMLFPLPGTLFPASCSWLHDRGGLARHMPLYCTTFIPFTALVTKSADLGCVFTQPFLSLPRSSVMVTAMSLGLVQCLACSRCSITACQTNEKSRRDTALVWALSPGEGGASCVSGSMPAGVGWAEQILASGAADSEVRGLPLGPHGQEATAYFLIYLSHFPPCDFPSYIASSHSF